ncbi:hypothetical protein LCGC14_0585120 [marine sediment metagenome]|uniref:Uncharacterized protein n=1 Tax=marine sediment metagenome TaxID=412755 RepID=A0A0F9RF42_9ZZZZ
MTVKVLKSSLSHPEGSTVIIRGVPWRVWNKSASRGHAVSLGEKVQRENPSLRVRVVHLRGTKTQLPWWAIIVLRRSIKA